ncbi:MULTISPECIES: hypothetical protein [unclassified Ruegeria]|uniref:hypothetical protein n=1 Tax=unclassified Ruegeria TaxID=2625375 RepID=UPI0014882052|nr:MULTISPECIES: hypothetical protein [unclassified Ruegeria]
MRRILLHLGLHKTGTTAAQSFLFENRELIWPHFALVLPYRTRNSGLSRAATNHSVYGLAGTLSEFERQISAFLDTLDFGEKRGLIVSEENFAGLRPSRNLEQGYAAAPELAASLVNAVRHRFSGQEVEITVYLSLRQRGSWLRSLWAHDLQRMRQVQDFETYCESMEPLAPLQATVDRISEALPNVTVLSEWLEDLQKLRFGPGAPFADFLDLHQEKANLLAPPAHSNPRLPKDVLAELLDLNRSRLDEAALVAQKKAIVEHAQKALIGTI